MLFTNPGEDQAASVKGLSSPVQPVSSCSNEPFPLPPSLWVAVAPRRRRPWVCGVSSLGIDHIQILGDTIEKIAWQKGGIFKVGLGGLSRGRASAQSLRTSTANHAAVLSVT